VCVCVFVFRLQQQTGAQIINGALLIATALKTGVAPMIDEDAAVVALMMTSRPFLLLSLFLLPPSHHYKIPRCRKIDINCDPSFAFLPLVYLLCHFLPRTDSLKIFTCNTFISCHITFLFELLFFFCFVADIYVYVSHHAKKKKN
jgi:hypothetical protein